MTEPRKPVRLERSIIRRRADRPEIAEGERTLVEFDPAELAEMLRQGRAMLNQIERLLRPSRQRRPRRIRS